MSNNKNNIWNLIVGKLHHELDEEESLQLEDLLENEENQFIFQKAQKINNSFDKVNDLKGSGKQTSWKSIHSTLRTKKIRLYSTRFIRYAAIIVFAFLIGHYFNGGFENIYQKTKYAEVEVLNGQTGHIFLFDGTEVWLNSGTKLKYPSTFNSKDRTVELIGEAFFKVAHNKNLPFKVKTGMLEVEVLGTSFNVSAYEDEENQSVVLVEGKVQLNNLDGNKIANILPGQMVVKNSSDKVLVTNVNTYSHTSWKEGKVSFTAERMVDIAKKLERWYNVEITFKNENLKDYEFTGTILRNKPIDQTIMALELLAPIKFNYQVMTNEKDQITIIRR